jgi:hypothetical protein
VAIQILENPAHGAVFYSSTTDWAFGPVMPDAEVAEAFLRSLGRFNDPRMLTDEQLEKTWYEWKNKLLHCPEDHTDVRVENFSDRTLFYCEERKCSYVWDQDGNLVNEEEDEDEDDSDYVSNSQRFLGTRD